MGTCSVPCQVNALRANFDKLLEKFMGNGQSVNGFTDNRTQTLATWFDTLAEEKKILFWQIIEPLSKDDKLLASAQKSQQPAQMVKSMGNNGFG